MIQVKNFTRTFLAAAIDAVQTTITVASGTGATFPELIVGDYVYATLVHPVTGLHEIVKIIDLTGDVFTVLRAQDDSPAMVFPTASELSIQWNKSQVAEFAAQENALVAVDPIVITGQDISLKVQPGVTPGEYGNVTVDTHGLITAIGAAASIGYATETTPGLSEIATGPEATAGVDATRFITPFTLNAVIDAFTAGSLDVAGQSMTLGNGAILKWGSTTYTNPSGVVETNVAHPIVYPVPFPTATLTVVSSHDVAITSLTAAGFTGAMTLQPPFESHTTRWLALGH